MSGSVSVNVLHAACRPEDFHDRKMDTHISWVSGSIHATLPHSYRTTLKTVSGGITANLHPHGSTTKRSDIVLANTSGTTNVTVHPHVADPGHPLTRLSTTYKGVSGNVKLAYPLTWQGHVGVHTNSGTIKMNWPSLRAARLGLRTSATVGEGEGGIWVGGVSSNVELVEKAFGFDECAARPSAEAAQIILDDTEDLPPPTYEEAMKS